LVGGVTTSDVAAASPAAGVLDIYVRGSSTGSLVTRRAVGATWGAWQDAGGGLAAGPWAAVVPGTGRTEVWIQGSDGYMYLRARSSTGVWGAYLRLS
jgi:hypothetical protein